MILSIPSLPASVSVPGCPGAKVHLLDSLILPFFSIPSFPALNFPLPATLIVLSGVLCGIPSFPVSCPVVLLVLYLFA